MTDNTDPEASAAESNLQIVQRLAGSREKITDMTKVTVITTEFFDAWVPLNDDLQGRKEVINKQPESDEKKQQLSTLRLEEIELVRYRKQFESRLPKGPREPMH